MAVEISSSPLFPEEYCEPGLILGAVEFSDGTKVECPQGSITVLVGPNNSGKSAALRGIRDMFYSSKKASLVVRRVSFETVGTIADLAAWLEANTVKTTENPSDPLFSALGVRLNRSTVERCWKNAASGLQEHSRLFVNHLSAEARLEASNPAPAIAVLREPMTHPIHVLYRDDSAEAGVSAAFKKAFGKDLIVNRAAGSVIPLHVGIRPKPKENEDRVSVGYVKAVESLPTLQEQGDGMRSYAGITMAVMVGTEAVVLLDEPEAFLHPPQAKLIGRMLADSIVEERQLFVATHSGDVLRGILDARGCSVSILRITRDGDVNRVRELKASDLREFWSDSLLRFSNILDGIFHECVIVCESDSDCRFFAAVVDAIVSEEDPDGGVDVMFVHCGGKHRVPMVVNALRRLEVPVLAVLDIDVLSDEKPLRPIVEAMGGDFTTIEGNWKAIKRAIEERKPELSTSEVRERILKICDAIESDVFPTASAREIKRELGRATPWANVKQSGRSAIPKGQPTMQFDELIATLQVLGILVVERGELEGFAPSIGKHGPGWVAAALERDLLNDSEFRDAREFVARMLNMARVASGGRIG